MMKNTEEPLITPNKSGQVREKERNLLLPAGVSECLFKYPLAAISTMIVNVASLVLLH